MIPSAAARRASAASDTAASRQPDRPHAHGSARSRSGRCATAPAADLGPWCTVPPVAKAASTTLPTNMCTTLERLRRSPNSCSARISARAWLSIRTGSLVARDSSSRTGTFCQRRTGCSTMTPASGSTQPPVAIPSPSGWRPEACSARNRGIRLAMRESTPVAQSPSCAWCSQATTRPRRSTMASVAFRTAICSPQTTVRSTSMSTGTCGRPGPFGSSGCPVSSRSSPARSRSTHSWLTAAGLSPASRAIVLLAIGP